MIPKIIHRLWINPPGPPMPAEFKEYGRRWKELHPGWEVRDWESIDELYPLDNQRYYDRASQYAIVRRDNGQPDIHRFRSSMTRLEIMNRIGGVYIDADTEPLKPIDELIEGAEVVLAYSVNTRRNGDRVVSDSFFASVPGHPFFELSVARIPESAEKYRWKHTAVNVGPYHTQRLLDEFPDWRGLKILEPWVLYPQSIIDRNRGLVPDLSRAYAWHKWANTRRS